MDAVRAVMVVPTEFEYDPADALCGTYFGAIRAPLTDLAGVEAKMPKMATRSIAA